jgi:AcrR family transcriptional regulator
MYQGVHNVAATPDIPRRLPRGTHGLDPSLVAASQRTRLLEAAGRAVAEKGYAAATIDDIVRGAGVSKKTFYEHFQDKLGCFLAAYEAASDELYEHVRAAQEAAPSRAAPSRAAPSRGAPSSRAAASRAAQEAVPSGAASGDWLARTHAGIRAYLRWLAAEPALARVFLIEVAAAGPEALARRERLRDRYAERMRELQESDAGVPDEIFHAVVAAADDLVVRRLREGSDLMDLEPILLRLQVALLAGPQAAAQLA